jgi:hypothetical protein
MPGYKIYCANLLVSDIALFGAPCQANTGQFMSQSV